MWEVVSRLFCLCTEFVFVKNMTFSHPDVKTSISQHCSTHSKIIMQTTREKTQENWSSVWLMRWDQSSSWTLDLCSSLPGIPLLRLKMITHIHVPTICPSTHITYLASNSCHLELLNPNNPSPLMSRRDLRWFAPARTRRRSMSFLTQFNIAVLRT